MDHELNWGLDYVLGLTVRRSVHDSNGSVLFHSPYISSSIFPSLALSLSVGLSLSLSVSRLST